jgi:hypothetical protein
MDQALKTADTGTRVVTIVNFTATAAMPARYALERADWKGAAALPVTSTQFPAADSLTRFARGLGMARSGDLAGAKREVEALQALQKTLEKITIPIGRAARKSKSTLSPRGWPIKKALVTKR